ncbi:MAG: hypothetical protein GWN84_02290 [Gammaproteobacteria bacterium]|nr:hypothetical protein [Gammaproteobacteria bacterium]NIR81977.1 hypothetical protein [Gammaproteobacteria bacterium]NIR89029.1 hypothetical protein [Gammaproteobacteria bacterium]NIU03084.1 hypothetical protein [Gammaproteobacteria bacterium]NIV50608.1 hypothetical protein [Gammaproteobacteria bacterium]
MSDHRRKRQRAARLLEDYIRNDALLRGPTLSPGTESVRRSLERWQRERLVRTYADLRRHSRYGPAVEFFLNDLYGPKNFQLHEHHFEQIYPVMVRLLPSDVLNTVAQAVEFDVLTRELDMQMLRVLVEELRVTNGISEEVYAEAYRRCDNYDRRLHQIELVHEVGGDLEELVHKRLVYAALRLARRPARLAGLGDLQDFLERGFAAFRNMRGADKLLDIIVHREKTILDRIYNRHPQPFDLSAS